MLYVYNTHKHFILKYANRSTTSHTYMIGLCININTV